MGEDARSVIWSAVKNSVIRGVPQVIVFLIDSVIAGEKASNQIWQSSGLTAPAFRRGSGQPFLPALNRLTTGLGLPPGPG